MYSWNPRRGAAWTRTCGAIVGLPTTAAKAGVAVTASSRHPKIAGPVLHPLEPGLDQRGEPGDVALGQVGQGPIEVRPHESGRVELVRRRRELEDLPAAAVHPVDQPGPAFVQGAGARPGR